MPHGTLLKKYRCKGTEKKQNDWRDSGNVRKHLFSSFKNSVQCGIKCLYLQELKKCLKTFHAIDMADTRKATCSIRKIKQV